MTRTMSPRSCSMSTKKCSKRSTTSRSRGWSKFCSPTALTKTSRTTHLLKRSVASTTKIPTTALRSLTTTIQRPISTSRSKCGSTRASTSGKLATTRCNTSSNSPLKLPKIISGSPTTTHQPDTTRTTQAVRIKTPAVEIPPQILSEQVMRPTSML